MTTYVIVDLTRTACNDFLVFWKTGNHGYSTFIEDARVITDDDVKPGAEFGRLASDLVLVPVELITPRALHVVPFNALSALNTDDIIKGSELFDRLRRRR